MRKDKIQVFKDISIKLKSYLFNEENFRKNMEENFIGIIHQDFINNIENQIINYIHMTMIEIYVDYYHILKNKEVIKGENIDERIENFRKITQLDNFLKTFLAYYSSIEIILDSSIKDLVNTIMQVLKRFKKDKKVIKQVFNLEGNINDIQVGLGDSHANETVSLVKLGKDFLIYKPRSSYTDIIYEEVLDVISTDLIEMKTPKTINNIDYSWHEYIQQLACKNIDQVKNFYIRAGVHLAVTYSLGTTDIHYENLIACGEFPVLVDTETLLKATRNILGESSPKSIERSVAITGMLPLYSESGVFDFGISALFMKESESKKIKVYKLAVSEIDDFIFKEEFGKIKPTKNQLISSNGYISDNEACNILVRSFERAMKNVILRKNEIFKILYNYRKTHIAIRQLLRPTQVYHKFIKSLTHPDVLKDKNKKEDILRIFLNTFRTSKFGYLRVLDEIEKIKKGYIPSYSTLIDGHDLLSEGKIICKNYYDISPLQCAIKRINEIDEEMINLQSRYIKMTVTSQGKTDNIITGQYNKQKWEKLNKNTLEKELHKYMSKLSQYIAEINDGTKYIDLLIPTKNSKELNFSIASSSFDIYYSLGIAWLFIEYGMRYPNKSDFKEIGEKMIKHSINKYEYTSKKEGSDVFDYSLYNGLGGLLYICYYLYNITKKPYYYKTIQSIVNDLYNKYKKLNFTISDFDYLTGISGTLYLLNEISKTNNIFFENHKLLFILKRYKTGIENFKEKLNDIGIAHGISGILLPLVNYKEFSKSKECILLDLLKKENHMINSSLNLQYTWCRGLLGIISARNTMIKNLTQSSNELREVINYINTEDLNEIKVKSLKLKNKCLCHGVCGNIDIMLSEEMISFEDLYPKDVFKDISNIKWFNKYDYSWENFMLGNSGVAYCIMRLLHNSPSLLKIDIERYG